MVATLFAAMANAWAAGSDAVRPGWLLANMDRLGVATARLSLLVGLKAAGAAGLVAGIAVPAVGVAAAGGLVLSFLGAIVTVVRAGWYEHWYPVAFLALAVASLALRLTTL